MFVVGCFIMIDCVIHCGMCLQNIMKPQLRMQSVSDLYQELANEQLGGRDGKVGGEWASSRWDFGHRCWTGSRYRPGPDFACSFRLDGRHLECWLVYVVDELVLVGAGLAPLLDGSRISSRTGLCVLVSPSWPTH